MDSSLWEDTSPTNSLEKEGNGDVAAAEFMGEERMAEEAGVYLLDSF